MKIFSKFICIFAFAAVALVHADVVENKMASSAGKSIFPREHRSS